MSEHNFRRAQVRKEEIDRVHELLDKQLLKDVRVVIATPEGRRLVHWFIYEAGSLQRSSPPVEPGRRELAIEAYGIVDRAAPGSPEEIALEMKKQRIIDDAGIQSAIENRRDEYE